MVPKKTASYHSFFGESMPRLWHYLIPVSGGRGRFDLLDTGTEGAVGSVDFVIPKTADAFFGAVPNDTLTLCWHDVAAWGFFFDSQISGILFQYYTSKKKQRLVG